MSCSGLEPYELGVLCSDLEPYELGELCSCLEPYELGELCSGLEPYELGELCSGLEPYELGELCSGLEPYELGELCSGLEHMYCSFTDHNHLTCRWVLPRCTHLTSTSSESVRQKILQRGHYVLGFSSIWLDHPRSWGIPNG